MQPHSGAVITVLNYLQQNPKPRGTTFEVRAVTPSKNKPYALEITRKSDYQVEIRTGKSFGCYATATISSQTNFDLKHSHSGLHERFTLKHNQLYYGLVDRDQKHGFKSVSVLESIFEADFSEDRKRATIRETVEKDGKKAYWRYDYTIDRVSVPGY